MWTYDRKLQYPVKIKNPNAALAKIIISQLGGPDGELAASTPCSGSIKHVGEKSRKLMVGADVNQDGVPQCISNIKITGVNLYDGGISIEQAAALYKKATIPTA